MGSAGYEVKEEEIFYSREELTWPQTILLVEDEAFVREVTSEVLQSAGYRVLMAKNAIEAARLYERQGGGVDLLLTDIVLPGESGWSFAGRMRQQFGTKVVLMSGYAEQFVLQESETVLAKPFSREKLLERVSQALDRFGEEQNIAVRRVCAGT
jgi:two-component system, cell cycle sensor histidine kinase and response regulator CckA